MFKDDILMRVLEDIKDIKTSVARIESSLETKEKYNSFFFRALIPAIISIITCAITLNIL